LRLFSVILIWVMIIPFVKQTAVFTSFQINRAIIAEKSCENISPESNCHGTCQLVKAVKKQEPEQDKRPYTPNTQKNANDLQWFFQNHSVESVKQFKPGGKLIAFWNKALYDNYPSGIFHPPKV
jgi:hypothetical protein